MKIVFNRQQIINIIAPMMCAVGMKGTNPATEYIHIEANNDGSIVFTTYDLEKGIKCNAEGKVIEGGDYCVNASKFVQTLKVMDGDEITLEVNANLETSISSGKSFYKMQSLNGSDFPIIPQVKSGSGFEVKASVLKSMIAKITYAMGVNDQRPVLNGAFFRITENRLLIVSCDSFKLAKCVCETNIRNLSDGDSKYQYIVPNKTVVELYRMLPDGEDDTVVFNLSHKSMVCSFDGLTFYSRLIEGEYIDFDRIIIKTHKINITVDKAQLLAALERAAVVTEEKVPGSTRTPLKFSVEGNILKLNAVSSVGVSYDELEIDHNGDDIVISFNNRNLIDSVKVCSGEKIRIELSTPLYSINLVPVNPGEGTDDIFFMMPVRTRD
ncbi:MAG: DNA polymerase III subunit beta [Clostridia bacterium]|nr:DNA polymerase III subunit beta [Clostridia bacterium]